MNPGQQCCGHLPRQDKEDVERACSGQSPGTPYSECPQYSNALQDECLCAKHSDWCGLAGIMQAIVKMFPNNCAIMFPTAPAYHLGQYPPTMRTRTIDLPQVQVLVGTVLSMRVLWHPLLVGMGPIMEGHSLPLPLYSTGGTSSPPRIKCQQPAVPWVHHHPTASLASMRKCRWMLMMKGRVVNICPGSDTLKSMPKNSRF